MQMNSRQALDRFDLLLADNAREAEFQELFSECPEIFSLTLPLRLEPSDVRPLARRGKSEPDFLAYPSRGMDGEYGIIELKRPGSQILVEPRKGQLELSRTALTAFGQGARYRDKLRALQTKTPALMLGNQAHIFVIMGLSNELADKLGTELYEKQITGGLPPDCRLIPYDTLFQAFAQAIPPQIMILVPDKVEDHASILRRVEDNLFDWGYFDLTERSLKYWIAIDAEVSSALGSAPAPLDRSRFVVASGPHSGHLATEADNPEEFFASVVRLLHRLRDAIPGSGGLSGIEAFLEANRWLVGKRAGGADVNSALTVLREAARRCLHEGRSEILLTGPDAALAELEQYNVIVWAWMDSAGSRYLIHPGARFLL